ncbi:Guanosine-diphosphatase [Dissophora globulifera]|nr:Guanosine-diphosphatase [Dissophora globulifera]
MSRRPDPAHPPSLPSSTNFAFIPEQNLPASAASAESVSAHNSTASINARSSGSADQHPNQQKRASTLVRRTSIKLPKRISSSSLLPTNYSNKRKLSSAASTRDLPLRTRNLTGVGRSDFRHNVMALRDRIMARKGYWFRNGAILAFCLTLFFFVMLPRRQPNIHNNVPIDPLLENISATWPQDITSEHCDVASPGRPLIQYVLMIDAGSSGSRIHAYKFNYCKATPELESELFEQVAPGLSKYDEDAEGAARSLDPLLEAAVRTVPKFLHKSTPVAVKATAGLRLLGETKADNILAAVRRRLETSYSFPIIKEEGVAVMSGADEGVYAWVTVNYLLERINSFTKTPTVAVLDLGGASTQIVFEPKVINGHSVAQGDHRRAMGFNGNDYVLFQHSYLGYGLNEARNQINKYLVEHPIPNTTDMLLEENEYLHPCIPVHTKMAWQYNGRSVTLVGVSDPIGECRRVVEAIFYKNEVCKQEPCSFHGVYQPSLATSFESDIYAFSYIFDRVAPFRLGSNTPTQDMTLLELAELTDRVCVADETDFKEFESLQEAKWELNKVAEMCMDLSYINALLGYGYGIPQSRKINLAKKINNYETGWCLGASIQVLEDQWYIGA